MNPGPPKFYFSFWSPYSWIAARLLEERLGAARFGVQYTPYWPPDARTFELLRSLGGEFLYVHMSRQKHLYILQDIKRITGSLGWRHCWPIDDKPWMDLPHLAFLMAERLGKGKEFFWAIHQARWEGGRDIWRVETIRDLAREVGLEPDVVAGAPDDPSVRREGAEALASAYRDHVFGVPFFVKGREQFWGVDRLGGFLAALEGRPYRYVAGGALREGAPEGDDANLPAEAVRAVGGYDHDCAGGCG